MEDNLINVENGNERNISDDVKVSVIIPVYKVRPYIERCLDVMQNQTLREIEIIYVDDCGGDDAIKVVEERAKTDGRIKILYNEINSGAGPSRNRGIDIARGKYLGFIDADDSVDLNYYETLYKLAEKHQCEVVKAACITVYGDRQATSAMYKQFKDFPECSERTDWHNLFTFEHWCAIYRADFVREHGSRYGNTSTGQDAVFLLSTMYYARRVAFTYDTNYYYYKHAGSLDTTRSREFFLAKMQVYSDFIDFFNANDENPEENCKTLSARFDTTVNGYYKSLLKNYGDDEEYQLQVLKALNEAILRYKHSDLLYKTLAKNNSWEKAISEMEKKNYKAASDYLRVELVRLSIILPVYNLNSETKRCIDRILNYFFELIIIDIVQTEEANTYFADLVLQHSNNQIIIRKGKIGEKIGGQINAAMDSSCGKYVMFMTQTDFLKPNTLTKLYNAAVKDNLDFAAAKSLAVKNAEIDDLSKAPRFPDKGSGTVINFFENSKFFTKNEFPICSMIFKKQFLNENHIRFSERQSFGERSLLADVLIKARRFKAINLDMMVHTVPDYNTESTENDSFTADLFGAYSDVYKLTESVPQKFRIRIIEKELSFIFETLKETLNKFKNKENYRKVFSKVKELLSNFNAKPLEELYASSGEEMSQKPWYTEYICLLNMESSEYAAANKIKFKFDYSDYSYDDSVKISVIIPVYNMENYIRECIESITYQTLTDFEIICVDDCSTDNSLELLNSLSEADPRIKVIAHSENLSSSQARKDGVAAAHGKYIMFVDADDTLRPSALETLYNEMESHPVDILHFGTEIINEADLPQDRVDKMSMFVKPFKGSFSGFGVFQKCFGENKYKFSLWNKIYNAQLVKYAFSHIKDGSFPKAQDLYAYFVISFFAESYRGLPDKTFYEYHFGRGITGHNQLTLDQFQIYCQMGLVADAVKNFIIEQGYEKAFEKELRQVRAGLEGDCVSQWNNNLPDENKLEGYELMVKYFPAPEIIARIIKLYPDDQGEIAKMLAASHTLDVKKTEVRTVGMHYFRLDTGGVQRVIALLSKLYIEMGYNVVVFADEPITEDVFGLPEEVKIVQLNGINRDYNKLGIYLMEFSEQLAANNVDLVVEHTWSDAYFLLARELTTKSLGIPFVVHCHNVFTVPVIDTKSFYSDMPYIYALCDGVAALSDADREYWQQFNDRVTVVANPFTFDLNKTESAPLSEKNVIWVARVANEKRPTDPIDIFKLVTAKIPEAKLFYVGGSKTEQEMDNIKKKIDKEGLSNNIVVTGFVTNIDEYYLKSSVFLCTSIYEGFPMTLLEEQTFGLPAVVYDMPWLTLSDGSDGIIKVPQGDKQRAADAIVELLNNEELRLEMGKQAKENVERFADYDYEGVWKSIFDKALKSKGVKKLPHYQAVMFETFCTHYKYHISKMQKLRKPTDKIVVSSTEQLTEKEMIQKLKWFRVAMKEVQKGKKIPEPDYAAYESNEIKRLKKELEKCQSDLKKKSDDCKKLLSDANFYRSELDGTRNSLSFRIARAITWLPRKLRALLKK